MSLIIQQTYDPNNTITQQDQPVSDYLGPKPQRKKAQMWANTAVPNNFSLFGYMDKKGQLKHMAKNIFLAFCYNVWERAAMKHVLGHSFRNGRAVTLLLAGV
ncbi:hypothetical protein BT96DRAFT_1010972 [Gymnopus androsaceus JB14]|uniref:Uncharacterized protein n=1 Tax=Gymnopus androsaceus JB14 TaxID=1447944 RepID=A0A6A4G9Y0_9AGAR|nr:hypothetical protein BT96DRAFT_1010972 [Gymnopus androsaceus JB14]